MDAAGVYDGPPDLCEQVSVNRTMPTGLAHTKSGASGSAYVTYRRPQDAQRCVETVDGVTWSGVQTARASDTAATLTPSLCCHVPVR